MGNFWVWFWLIVFWGAREVQGSHGRTGLRAGVLSNSLLPPPGWNPINENLFLSKLIVGSCTKVPRDHTLVFLVTLSF